LGWPGLETQENKQRPNRHGKARNGFKRVALSQRPLRQGTKLREGYGARPGSRGAGGFPSDERRRTIVLVSAVRPTAQGNVLMLRLILTPLVLAIFIHPLYAQSSLYTDRSGYTTGTQDGRSVNTYTDRYGNTTGWVGGKYQNTYSDGYGGTTGTLGNKRINTYDDGYGNTTGTIGRDRINLHTDPTGATTGTVGQRRLNCYSNRFRTTCY
jgi:hypothetical protein